MLFSLGDYFTHTGLRLNVGQSNDLPPTNSMDLPTDCSLDQDRAPRCDPLSHTLFRRVRHALRALNMNRCLEKTEQQNNILYGIHKHAFTSGKQFILTADENLVNAEGQ